MVGMSLLSAIRVALAALLVHKGRSTLTSLGIVIGIGATPDLQEVRNWPMDEGRFLADDDNKKLAPVCVLGQTVRRKLFPDRADVLGQLVRVDRLQLRVIGVAAEKGRNPIGADQDDQI